MYLSLGYFYYKKYQLNNLYGPSQLCLIFLQFIGMICIGINYLINTKEDLNEISLFFLDNKKIYFFGYLLSSIFCFVLFLITLGLIIQRKRKNEIYNILNESK